MDKLTGRALHFVFKIGDRKASTNFYTEILGMKILRHEEFDEGCEATCNGPYANRWSKTMLGYGSEHNHFAIELTYNYPIKQYKLGNDFIGITIQGSEILQRARDAVYPIHEGNVLKSPDGYKFYILDEPQPTENDPIKKVTLACSNLQETIKYWNKLLTLQIFEQDEKKAVFGFDVNKTMLELQQIDKPIDRATAYGRIAFSIPHSQQEAVSKEVEKNGQTILTPLITLDTPGKATVRVIILADPDGHEICFVEDEGYRKLSEYDPDAEGLLNTEILKDHS